ncbi:hypothetical protein PYW08_016219 [Mythimna loreyi]|uniref:Uncharacterized protein n=1 Tax=Mythimna loreyi TaxID=667449 RepID=A0ACC2R1M0_9NEOP|nr:hypothetical protein PYW08_016219 [Mythimna loreyi]
MSSSKFFESFSITKSSNSSGGSKVTEVLSDFSDGSCGEPAFSQHLVLDFTPDAEIDNEISQKKICDFWKFINSTPEIKNLMVKPEKNLFTGDSKTEVAPESVKSELDDGEEESSVAGRGLGQAAHMLRFAEDKNLINTLFEAKLPQSMCSLGSREYKQSEAVSQPKKKKKHVCRCIPCRNPNCRNKRASNISREELSPLRTLSRQLNDWDAKHPKSMEPPGHPPTLQHCLIQRQMFPAPLDTINSKKCNF